MKKSKGVVLGAAALCVGMFGVAGCSNQVMAQREFVPMDQGMTGGYQDGQVTPMPQVSQSVPQQNVPQQPEATLTHWITRNERQNKSYAYDREVPGSKKAVLHYKVIGRSERYTLLEVRLMTGRHHQIRCQLAKIGCPIKGDLKYGARRSNPDGSISLLARKVEFTHPVSKEPVCAISPVPDDRLWTDISPR